MKYIEVKIFTHGKGFEQLSAELLMIGLTDFVIEDPNDVAELLNKKNDYDWDYIDESVLAIASSEPNVTLYLDDTCEGAALSGEIKSMAKKLGMHAEEKPVDDLEWKDNWKEFFKPRKVSERIVIKPTWEEYNKSEGELIIELDPGMAFGTGAHPTTSMCIRFMERFYGQFETMLDVGCGSGVLSIAAALLGAKEVLGVDIDSDAVIAAKENVKSNGLDGCVRIACGDLAKGIDFKADITAANLTPGLICLLAEDIGKNMKPGGLFIASGILIEKQSEVKAVIKKAGFEILDITQEGEWCAILARRRKDVI